MRVNQWTKNAVVLAAFVFAYWDRSFHLEFLPALTVVCVAAFLFCMTSSGIYLLNDVMDAPSDRNHPVKRNRPIAAGRLSTAVAVRLGVFLLASALAGAFLLDRMLLAVLFAYVVIQLAYSFGLKRIALVDVFVIASGFVLRAIAGGVALHVAISPWLLLCAFLLALFLALCKRRHEKVNVGGEDGLTRKSLGDYDERLLDQLVAIIAAATIVSYSMYTLSPDTKAKFGTHSLGVTIPFVVFGIFRYLDLVYRHEKGDRPEKILLTDVPLLIDLALYGICTILVFITCVK
jgi:4-hydroxybenzoate polyprenyltransferase